MTTIEIPRGPSDPLVLQIRDALVPYERDYSQARITLYRHNSVSVRVRIVDPSFEGRGKADRSRQVWQYLSKLTEEAQSEISQLLLLTEGEKASSLANREFETAEPSRL